MRNLWNSRPPLHLPRSSSRNLQPTNVVSSQTTDFLLYITYNSSMFFFDPSAEFYKAKGEIMTKAKPSPSILEITVISAEGIKSSPVSLFSYQTKCFITISITPTITAENEQSCSDNVYRTRVDEEGDVNPTWGDKFHIPLDSSFFTSTTQPSIGGSLYLQLYAKQQIMFGNHQPVSLGWCNIPASDMVDGPSPVGSPRFLSYRVRHADGSRGEGIVHLAVRLIGVSPVCTTAACSPTTRNPTIICFQPGNTVVEDQSRIAIGIPIRVHPYHMMCQG